MGFEDFPDIESFSKLPKKLIIKAGEASLTEAGDAILTGIVINNLGQTVKDVNLFLILFDDNHVPTEEHRVEPDPVQLSQGALGAFKFMLKGHKQKISNYYLHSRWSYLDAGWE